MNASAIQRAAEAIAQAHGSILEHISADELRGHVEAFAAILVNIARQRGAEARQE